MESNQITTITNPNPTTSTSTSTAHQPPPSPVLGPPPPYSADGPPHYETTLEPATLKFPASLNGYFQWRFTTTFHLGPSADKKLYAVSTQSSLFRSKQTLILHDGPSEKHRPLAWAESTRYSANKPFTVALASSSPTSPPITQTVENTSSSKRNTYAFTFPIPIPSPSTCASRRIAKPPTSHHETFEWRRSQGREINDLAGNSYGWKLVRLSARVRSSSTRSRRGSGATSDGREVVAVIAHNSSWSMTKGVKFAFLGTGLTGMLGEEWEAMVLMSALQLWGMDYQDQVLAAGAAS